MILWGRFIAGIPATKKRGTGRVYYSPNELYQNKAEQGTFKQVWRKAHGQDVLEEEGTGTF